MRNSQKARLFIPVFAALCLIASFLALFAYQLANINRFSYPSLNSVDIFELSIIVLSLLCLQLITHFRVTPNPEQRPARKIKRKTSMLFFTFVFLVFCSIFLSK